MSVTGKAIGRQLRDGSWALPARDARVSTAGMTNALQTFLML